MEEHKDDVLRFSTKRHTKKVVLENENGAESVYFLKEMNGRGREKFMKGLSDRIEVKNGQVSRIKKYEGMEKDLLKLCMFDENGEAVKESFLDELPARVLQSLHVKASNLNQVVMSKEVKDEVKND